MCDDDIDDDDVACEICGLFHQDEDVADDRAEHDRALQENAWDEGYFWGLNDGAARTTVKVPSARNPYRKEKP